MATAISSIVSQARIHLLETTASFWTDAELLDLCRKGAYDLWGAILDLHQEHFLTIDVTNVSMAANATSLTGVPADTFRVHLIEPRDLTGSTRNVYFQPRDYNHADFQAARASSAVDPTGGLTIYYCLIGAGSPVAAPTVKVAPALTSALTLTFVYVPGITIADAAASNPIPGESDQALINWIVAFARAKERDDRMPDPEWLALYATEKTNLKIRLTPRQTQEPEYVQGMFEDYY